MINPVPEASERCEYLKKQIDNVYAERAQAFSLLSVLYCTPDRYCDDDVKIVNSEKMKATFEAFMYANEKLVKLVKAYNELAPEANRNNIQVHVQG
ncbi:MULTISPECIES: hypothetical protein [Citrobacter freundii complex]|uniref:Uncharacterized protein n=1 Tax=Citrobacter braakii TaxID=57706 RepID=A0A1V8P299_CITBR|nr:MULTISPECIES: hypothetical protein [Citrobacter freundii complex]OPW96011.1 hypothetical protein BZK41_13560 [Citrobacter sp. A316]OQM42789.1 hypothetical protein BZK42_04355 [Citrobacter braakii]QXC18101.1 hypothetical protein I6L51_08570 [Citrobacter braakii]